MRSKRAVVLACWLFCAVVSVMSLIEAGSKLFGRASPAQPAQAGGDILFTLLPMLFAIPAALIITRQPRNTVGWLLMTPPIVALPVDLMTRYLASFRDAPPPINPIILLMLVVTGMSWMGFIIPLVLIPLFFPNGRLLSPRWRWVVYLAIGLCLFGLFWAAFTQSNQPDFASWTVSNPVGFITDEIAQYIFFPWSLLLALLTCAGVVSFVIRYRRAEPVEREQMKWLVYAFVLFGLVYIPSVIYPTEKLPPPLNTLILAAFALVVFCQPIIITIAILRYHLFDIDVIIRLTLVYALVTALLGLVFAGGTALLQGVFSKVIAPTSNLAVMLTTLAIVVLFNPLRQRVQGIIDRRFYRQKYNAEMALGEFAEAARGGSDVDMLASMLVELVQKTLQPSQVSIYVRTVKPEGNERPKD